MRSNKKPECRLSTLFLIFVFSIIGNFVLAQPSSTINFAFRLYDKTGKQLNKEEVCANWKITMRSDMNVDPCVPLHRRIYFDDSSGYFIAYVGTIFPPYKISFTEKANPRDTMTLIFPNHVNVLYDDKLTFNKGIFLIKNDCKVSKTADHPFFSRLGYCTVKKLNWKKAGKAFHKSTYARYETHRS